MSYKIYKFSLLGFMLLMVACALLPQYVLTPSQVQERIQFFDGQEVRVQGYLVFEHHQYAIWDAKSVMETYLSRLEEFENDPCLNIDVSKAGYKVLQKANHKKVVVSGVIQNDIFKGEVAFGSCTVPGIYVDADSLKIIE